MSSFDLSKLKNGKLGDTLTEIARDLAVMRQNLSIKIFLDYVSKS